MYHDKDIARLRHTLKTSASIIVTHEKLARHGESRIPQHRDESHRGGTARIEKQMLAARHTLQGTYW